MEAEVLVGVVAVEVVAFEEGLYLGVAEVFPEVVVVVVASEAVGDHRTTFVVIFAADIVVILRCVGHIRI